MVIIIHKHVVS